MHISTHARAHTHTYSRAGYTLPHRFPVHVRSTADFDLILYPTHLTWEKQSSYQTGCVLHCTLCISEPYNHLIRQFILTPLTRSDSLAHKPTMPKSNRRQYSRRSVVQLAAGGGATVAGFHSAAGVARAEPAAIPSRGQQSPPPPAGISWPHRDSTPPIGPPP